MAKVQTRFKNPKRVRHFIREWRKHRGLSMEELAERVELTHGAISQLERGIVNYTQPTLEALAEALGCEPADLIMRNPLDDEAPWTIWDSLKPVQQKQAIRLMKALADEPSPAKKDDKAA